ncbi:MAG: DUF882 domain-containing protein [Alphaproteobacteria bacterium]|nr:DUF882 domain-containing protein [Alphaproteobacteria bacterium]MCL2505503.1 DUF882 domain-containing protein [Alphaproteobacteria bacterium]
MKIFKIILSTFIIAALCAGCASSPHIKNVSGRGLPKVAADRDPVRRIVIVHVQSKERIDVTYFNNGKYNSAALKKINNIMRDRNNGKVGSIDVELIDYMVDLRKRMGLPAHVEFQVSSGYRSPATNAKLAKTNSQISSESLHMRGWAVDFRIIGVNGKAMGEIAKTMQRGGVSYYPNTQHLHIDIGNIRTW